MIGALAAKEILRKSRLAPLARGVPHRLFRAGLRMRCWYADFSESSQGRSAGIPPAMLRFRVSELLPPADFLRIGQGCAQLVARSIGSLGGDLGRAQRVLDFGCGCGRTIRWLIDEYGSVEFHGVDVDASAVEWCRAHLSKGFFFKSNPEPPLAYPDAHFDIIYAVSVFTHLDEPMQDLWLAELRRLLKPGGLLLITVHGERTAARALDTAGLETLRSAGFLHRRSGKLKGIMPEWYHTSWHSEAYIVERLSRWLQNVRYEVVADGTQDLVIGKACD